MKQIIAWNYCLERQYLTQCIYKWYSLQKRPNYPIFISSLIRTNLICLFLYMKNFDLQKLVLSFSHTFPQQQNNEEALYFLMLCYKKLWTDQILNVNTTLLGQTVRDTGKFARGNNFTIIIPILSCGENALLLHLIK